MPANRNAQGHTFEDYYKRAVNPMIILALLSERPKYAYEMTQELKTKTLGGYTTSLLYSTLSRLQARGYIEPAGKVISENNRVRNYYRITAAGTSHLLELKLKYAKFCAYVDQIVDDFNCI